MEKAKDIIIFHLNDSKNLRGGERQMLYLIEELNKLGYTNIVVCRKNYPLYLKCIEKNIKTLTLPYLFDWDIYSVLIFIKKIKKIKKNFNKIIIHSHTAHTASIAFLVKKITHLNIKTVVHRRVDFKLNGLLSTLKYKNADAIISISNAIKSIMINSGIKPSKIYLVRSSLPDELIKKNSIKKSFLDGNFIVGTLTTLVSHKDPLTLIEAAKIVIEKNRNIIFKVGGEGPLFKTCIKKIYEYKLEKNFFLLGYVTNNFDFLKEINLFVMPSKEEGLGSAIIEAMTFGLPVVGTDAGGIKEIVKDGINGFIVPKQNPQKLAEAIL
ncbi:MAG: glycosyltransferase, partial [Elusimicrobiales bacterium]|nr:glycosyltransferase [Elusimicrobiales bacterium]